MSDDETLAFDSAVLMLEVNPLGLTNDAIDVLHAASPALAGQAIEARRLAQLATLPPSARPLETKSVERSTERSTRTSPPTRDPARVVTRRELTAYDAALKEEIADVVVLLVKRVIDPIKERLDHQRQTIEKLERQVLELEAAVTVTR